MKPADCTCLLTDKSKWSARGNPELGRPRDLLRLDTLDTWPVLEVRLSQYATYDSPGKIWSAQ